MNDVGDNLVRGNDIGESLLLGSSLGSPAGLTHDPDQESAMHAPVHDAASF